MVERRRIKQDFFNHVNLIVDWRPISNIINKHYQKGESATGRPSYDGLVLFKMALLQTWYGLSGYEVEDRKTLAKPDFDFNILSDSITMLLLSCFIAQRRFSLRESGDFYRNYFLFLRSRSVGAEYSPCRYVSV